MIHLASHAPSPPGSPAAAWLGGGRGPSDAPGPGRRRRAGRAWPFLSRQSPRTGAVDAPSSAASPSPLPAGSAG